MDRNCENCKNHDLLCHATSLPSVNKRLLAETCPEYEEQEAEDEQ